MHHQRQTAKRTANATDSIIDGKSKGMELTSSHQLVKPQFKQMIMIFAKKKNDSNNNIKTLFMNICIHYITGSVIKSS